MEIIEFWDPVFDVKVAIRSDQIIRMTPGLMKENTVMVATMDGVEHVAEGSYSNFVNKWREAIFQKETSK